VAGELATEAGLTGWPAGEAEQGVRRCFDAWLAARGGAGNAEVRQMLRQVKSFIEAHGDGRFAWWHRATDDHSAKIINRAGIRRYVTADGTPIQRNSQYGAEFGDATPPDDTLTEYFILPEVFRTEVCKGFDVQAVCRVLLDHDVLNVEKGRHTVKVRLPGIANLRCYHIKPELLALDE